MGGAQQIRQLPLGLDDGERIRQCDYRRIGGSRHTHLLKQPELLHRDALTILQQRYPRLSQVHLRGPHVKHGVLTHLITGPGETQELLVSRHLDLGQLDLCLGLKHGQVLLLHGRLQVDLPASD